MIEYDLSGKNSSFENIPLVHWKLENINKIDNINERDILLNIFSYYNLSNIIQWQPTFNYIYLTLFSLILQSKMFTWLLALNFSSDFILNFVSFSFLKSLMHRGYFVVNDEMRFFSDYDLINNVFRLFRNLSLSRNSTPSFIDFQTDIFRLLTAITCDVNDFIGRKTIYLKCYGKLTYQIHIYLKHKIDEGFIYDFSYVPFVIKRINNNYYGLSSHFSKTYALFKPNKFSNMKFCLRDTKVLNYSFKLKLYYDSTRGELCKITFNLSDDLSSQIETKIKEYYRLCNTNIENVNKPAISKILSEISKLNDLNIVKRFIDLNLDKPIYLPSFYDFRGRRYYDGQCTPTNSKMARILFHYGITTVNTSNLEMKAIVAKYQKQIDEAKEKYNIEQNDENVFWILISMGKLKTSKSSEIPLIVFLENALNETYIFTDKYDEIEFRHYELILKEISQKIYKKSPLLKDATASVYQQLILLLNPKDTISLNITNLNSLDTWYDPYSIIITEFLKTHKTSSDFFTRTFLKKTMMTAPYSAGFSTCKKYLEKTLHRELNEIEKKEFKQFYKYINGKMELNLLFENSSSTLVTKLMQSLPEPINGIIKVEDGETSLLYFKMKTTTTDIHFTYKEKTIRRTKVWKKLTDQLDLDKIEQSGRANWVHIYDAFTIRYIERCLKRSIITIHDCFCIDYQSTYQLIQYLNHFFLKDENLRSLFVVI